MTTTVVLAGTPHAIALSVEPLNVRGVATVSPPNYRVLESFEQLCHEVSNPLMVVSGQIHLLERDVLRLTRVSDAERDHLLVELASIKGHVRVAVQLMDQERRRIMD